MLCISPAIREDFELPGSQHDVLLSLLPQLAFFPLQDCFCVRLQVLCRFCSHCAAIAPHSCMFMHRRNIQFVVGHMPASMSPLCFICLSNGVEACCVFQYSFGLSHLLTASHMHTVITAQRFALAPPTNGNLKGRAVLNSGL